MYRGFVSAELKKWLRDPMMSFMFFYPIVFGLIGRFGVPLLERSMGLDLQPFSDIILGIFTLTTPNIYGALIGFSILEDRDDNILASIKVTPLRVTGFLAFRLVLVTALAFLSTWFIVWFSKVGTLGVLQMVAVALLASLSAPFVGLLINATAGNKIEGFVAMKGIAGILVIFPIVSLFLTDAKELIFAPAPGFWPAKMISDIERGSGLLFLTSTQYFWFGLLYIIVLTVIAARAFIARVRL